MEFLKNQFVSVLIEWEPESIEAIVYKRINYKKYIDTYSIFDLDLLGYDHRDNKPVSTDLLYSELDPKFWSLDAAKAWCEERTGETILVKVENIEEITGFLVPEGFETIRCKTNILIPGTNIKREFNLKTQMRAQATSYHFGHRIEKVKIRIGTQSNGLFTTVFTDPDGVVSKQPYLPPATKDLLTKGLMWLGVIYLISVII